MKSVNLKSASEYERISMLRLAKFETEGWQLQSGVDRNLKSPSTFWIPDEASRRSLSPGDLVKLIFEYVFPQEGIKRIFFTPSVCGLK